MRKYEIVDMEKPLRVAGLSGLLLLLLFLGQLVNRMKNINVKKITDYSNLDMNRSNARVQ